MQTAPTQTVFTLFYLEDRVDPKILLVQRDCKLGWRIPSSKITDFDGFSGVNACSRTTINKMGNIDIRETSLVESCDYASLINWQDYESMKEVWDQEPYDETIKLLRNPFNYMWQKQYMNSFMWHDDEERQFIYFVPIHESDLPIIQKYANQGTSICLCQLTKLNELELSDKTKQFINYFKLPALIKSQTYKETSKTFIYIGFKFGGSKKFSPPKPFMHTCAIFDGVYRRRQEQWLQFNAPDDEIPNDEQLSKASAIILSGGNCSAYDELEWIKKIQKFLIDTYNNYKHLKFLTICFGLQVVIQTFGGKVEPYPQRREDREFHIYGNEELSMNVEEFRKVKCFEHLSVSEKLIINEYHGDKVTIIPELFVNLATSQNCQNEIVISKDHRIFGYQGHPEFSNHQQRLTAGWFISICNKKTVHEIMVDEMFLNNWAMGVNDKIHRDLCLAFIKD